MTLTLSPASGLGSYVGSAIEETYGTFVDPDKWHATDSFEVTQAPQYAQGNGIHGNTLVGYDAETIRTSLDAGGTFKTTAYFNGISRFIASLMGTLGITPTQVGATTAYRQVHAFAGGVGQSLSFQQLIPDVSGNAHVWNLMGAKVTQAEFSCSSGNPLEVTWTVDARDRYEVTPASDPAPIAPAASPFFSWKDLQIKVGAYGAETVVDGITSFATTIKRNMADKRFNAGLMSDNPSASYMVKAEPISNGFVDLTGTLETEYLNDDLFENYYQTDTGFSLIATWKSVQLAGAATPFELEIAYPRCRFLGGGDPTIPGPDIVKPSMPFTVKSDGSHNACTITLTNTETAL